MMLNEQKQNEKEKKKENSGVLLSTNWKEWPWSGWEIRGRIKKKMKREKLSFQTNVCWKKNIEGISMAAKSWPKSPFCFEAKPFRICPVVGKRKAGKRDNHY